MRILLAALLLACTAVHAQELTAPLVFSCPSAEAGSSLTPWVRCPDRTQRYVVASPDAIVATVSNSGTWEVFATVGANTAVLTCPIGAVIDSAGSCRVAGNTDPNRWGSKWVAKSTLTSAPQTNEKEMVLTWIPPDPGVQWPTLAGYQIYESRTAGELVPGELPPAHLLFAEVPAVTVRHVFRRGPGTYFYAVASYMCRQEGPCEKVESRLSNVVSKIVTGESQPAITFQCEPGEGIESVTPTCTWSSINATECTASGAWTGPRGSSGSEVLPVIQERATYGLACTGPGGTAQTSIIIAVTPRPKPPVLQ